MKRSLGLGLSMLLGVSVSAAGDAAGKIRPAAVAGSWYASDRAELTEYLDGLLADDRSDPPGEGGPVRAIIAPHAGYVFSGKAAADGYRLVRGRAYRRVIVLGPAHRGWFRGLSVADVTHYETPLGPIPLDSGAVGILRASDLVSADPRAHRQEHSIEMQLPLLQRALEPGWKLVPVLVGAMEGDDYRRAADLLRPLLDARTLLVASTDFTHYGPRYAYVPFPHDGHTAERLEQLDKGALDRVLAKDADGFLAYQADTGITICGARPVAILLGMLPDGAAGSLIGYTTSGELTGDYGHSVSYLTVVFRDGSPGQAREISRENMDRLHAVAVAAVETAARPRDESPGQRLRRLLEQMPPELRSPSGAFVTLKKHGELRGCIGYITPRKPLHQAVAENGINAAARDHRFPPVRAGELADLEVEVSVLTPPESIASYEDFQVGDQGIILEKNGRSAVFLPEVAVEQGWDREQTLNRLAQKAGLPADAWKEGASFKVFRAQKVSAPYTAGPE